MDGIELKKLRERLGLSQSQLGYLLGVTNAAISGWEAGRSPVPTLYLAVLMKLKQRADAESAKEIGSKVAGFLLIGGIFVFLAWLFNNED